VLGQKLKLEKKIFLQRKIGKASAPKMHEKIKKLDFI
jgi:hypothetical protein